MRYVPETEELGGGGGRRKGERGGRGCGRGGGGWADDDLMRGGGRGGGGGHFLGRGEVGFFEGVEVLRCEVCFCEKKRRSCSEVRVSYVI